MRWKDADSKFLQSEGNCVTIALLLLMTSSRPIVKAFQNHVKRESRETLSRLEVNDVLPSLPWKVRGYEVLLSNILSFLTGAKVGASASDRNHQKKDPNGMTLES